MKDNSSLFSTTAEFYDTYRPSAIMLILFAVIAVPGNLLVVVVNWKEKKMTNTNFLISIMAIVDFIGAFTAILNVLYTMLWFQILDIRFCKMMLMLNFSINTPGIYLIFGVSVLRYYHVCKPHLLYTIHRKMKLYCICVLIITLSVAVTFAICAVRQPWRTEELPGFACVIEGRKGKCGLTIKFALSFIILSYIFCLNGMIGLNFRILQRMFRQRKIMSRYKTVRKNKHPQTKQETNVKKTSKSESIAETTESLHTSINDLNEILDSRFNAKDISIKDNFSDKRKSTKSEGNESCDVSLNFQEKTENFIEHHREPQRKSSKIKSKGKSIQLNTDHEKHLSGKKEGFSFFDNIKTKSFKNGSTHKEYREGDSSKSEISSIGSMSVKHNDSVKTDGHDHDNKQSCHTKVISFPNKGNNAGEINEKRLERQQEKHYGKYYWHEFTYIKCIIF